MIWINISEGRAGFPDSQRCFPPETGKAKSTRLPPAKTRPVEECTGNEHLLWLLGALESYSMEKDMESKIKSPVTAKLVKSEGLVSSGSGA